MRHLQQSRSYNHPTINTGEQDHSTYNAAAYDVFIKEKNCCLVQFFQGGGRQREGIGSRGVGAGVRGDGGSKGGQAGLLSGRVINR